MEGNRFTKLYPVTGYTPLEMENFILVENKGSLKFYVKKENKTTYRRDDITNFLLHNQTSLRQGDTVSYVTYRSPLIRQVNWSLKLTKWYDDEE